MAQSQPPVVARTVREDMAVLVHDLGNHLQIAMSAVRIMAQSANALSPDELAAVMLHAAESLERAGMLLRLSSPADDVVEEETASIGALLTQMAPLLRYVCGPDIRIRLHVGLLPDAGCDGAAFRTRY